MTVLLIVFSDDLNWNQRMQVALAIAHVPEYLHCHNPLYQHCFDHPALIMLDQVGHLWFSSCSLSIDKLTPFFLLKKIIPKSGLI